MGLLDDEYKRRNVSMDHPRSTCLNEKKKNFLKKGRRRGMMKYRKKKEKRKKRGTIDEKVGGEKGRRG